jgi:hypothetical protein
VSVCFFSSFFPLASFFPDLMGLDAFATMLSPWFIAWLARKPSPIDSVLEAH